MAFLGACFDGLGRQPGVSEAPRKVRENAAIYANSDGSQQPIAIYNPELGYLLDGVTFVDWGDLECGRDASLAFERIRQTVAQMAEGERLPVVVGGDHYVTYPAVAALSEPLVVVHFDAHSDYLDEMRSCPHGSFMRAVGQLGHVARVIHLGLRGNLQTGPGIEASLARGNRLATTRQLVSGGPELLLNLLGEDVLSGRVATYVTFDVDVLDPSVAPGTGTLEPGGLPYSLARDLLTEVCRLTRVVGLDFVEFNPRLDWNGMTAKVVANLVLEGVSAAIKKGSVSHSLSTGSIAGGPR